MGAYRTFCQRRRGFHLLSQSPRMQIKWQTLLSNYKRIGGLHKETGTNAEVYFSLPVAARWARTLRANFDLFVYRKMHEWLQHKSSMTPPHFLDLLLPQNRNFEPASTISVADVEEAAFEEANLNDSTYNSVAAYDYVAEVDDDSSMHAEEYKGEYNSFIPPSPFLSPHFRLPHNIQAQILQKTIMRTTHSLTASLLAICEGGIGRVNYKVEGDLRENRNLPHAQPYSPVTSILGPQRAQSSQTRATLKLGGHVLVDCSTPILEAQEGNANDPLIISSSNASFGRPRKPTFGNTGIRRKKNGVGQSIVEATREGSKNLVKSLKEMNDMSKSIQERIMEMEFKLHQENMEYK